MLAHIWTWRPAKKTGPWNRLAAGFVSVKARVSIHSEPAMVRFLSGEAAAMAEDYLGQIRKPWDFATELIGDLVGGQRGGHHRSGHRGTDSTP